MQVGLMALQGWKREYDGWDAGGSLDAHDRARRAGRGPGLRVPVGLRPLPHRARPDRRDHVRVVLGAGGAGDGHRARAPRPHGRLHRLPEPGPDGQDGLDDRRHLRRAVRAGHRCRLEGRRVDGVRLRLPDPSASGWTPSATTSRSSSGCSAPGRASYEGEYAQVRGAINVPKGLQQPRIPIVVGGNGRNVTFRYAARSPRNSTSCSSSPDEVAELLPIIRQRCEEEDRDPATLRFSLYTRDEDMRERGPGTGRLPRGAGRDGAGSGRLLPDPLEPDGRRAGAVRRGLRGGRDWLSRPVMAKTQPTVNEGQKPEAAWRSKRPSDGQICTRAEIWPLISTTLERRSSDTQSRGEYLATTCPRSRAFES